MIKWDRLLVAFGALAPFWAGTNQADISFERIPKLRHLIEAKFSQPTAHRRHPAIVFPRVNVFVRLIGASAHGSEFEENEPSTVATHSFLAEKNRTAVLHPDKQRDKNEEWWTNDDPCRRGHHIEEALKIMIRRRASQLEAGLQRPTRH